MSDGSVFGSGLEHLGLTGRRIELHASFKSLQGVAGSPDSIMSELARVVKTVIVPTFSWGHSVPYAHADPIERNAAPPTPDETNSRVVAPFNPVTSDVDADMGILARTIARRPGAVRSDHPLASWAAWGEYAGEFVRDHPWDDPFLPIKRLAEHDGMIVLLGVSLTACTAIHLAEEMAGRRSFVRWSPDGQGIVRRARVGGCSDGFDRLLPHLRGFIHAGTIGPAKVLIAPLQPLLARASDVIRRIPDITVCERRCERCQAAAAGGPVV